MALIPFLVLAGFLERRPGVPAMIGARPRLCAYRDRMFASDEGARVLREMTDGFAEAARRRQQAQQQQ